MRPRRIMKFGGSSLADAASFEKAAKIVESRKGLNPIVVVSAVGIRGKGKKTTDLLKELCSLTLSGKETEKALVKIKKRHFRIIETLGLEKDIILKELEKLEEFLLIASKGGYGSEAEALDAVMGFGEILSSKIMESLLKREGLKYRAVLPGDFNFYTNDVFQDADILEESLEKIAAKIISCREGIVFPGYTGLTPDGRITTLGRGGSDYTAAVLGAALKRDVEIWTDVDGIYRISPGYLPEQFVRVGHPETIEEMSYDEAFQMAAFGSKVLHKKTLHAVGQAVRKGKHIRLLIKNTFNPDHPGTIVSGRRLDTGSAKGITCLEGTQLFNLYPDSYEESIQFLARLREVPDVEMVLASETWGRTSAVFDRYHKDLSKLESEYNSHLSRDQVLIKIVGDGIGENPRMLSRIHNVLQSAENHEKYGMNVVHKSPQLLTENTFEFLVKKRGFDDVIISLYKDLFMENTVNVGLLGMGTVGTGVLQYAGEMFSSHKAGFDLAFPEALVRNPDKDRGVKFEGKYTKDAADVLDDPLVDVVVELMGGLEPARSYILEAFKKGKHVVTANKALLAEHGRELFEAADKYHKNLGFEASVCAEIPIIDDFLKFPGLADVRGIQGIVNGTSNYVLSRFSEGMSIDDAVKIAQEKGFAEADPFMDVSGTDAAQKLSILASILFNQPIYYRDIPLQGLEGLLPVDRMAFEGWDVVIKLLAMAELVNDRISLQVGPALIPKTHPLAAVRDENNALALYLSGRSEPITKIGKGAGAIPTARSVVRDILDVSRKARAHMVDLPGFFKAGEKREVAAKGDFCSEWYLRFNVDDSAGVFGRISSIIGDFNLSIRRVLQEENPFDGVVYVLFEIKESPRSRVDEALDLISRFPFVKDSYCCMIL